MQGSSGSQFLSVCSLVESSSHLQLPSRCSRCKDSRHQWLQYDSWCAFHPGKKQRSHISCPDSNLINLEKHLQGTLTDSRRKFTIGSGEVVLTVSIILWWLKISSLLFIILLLYHKVIFILKIPTRVRIFKEFLSLFSWKFSYLRWYDSFRPWFSATVLFCAV